MCWTRAKRTLGSIKILAAISSAPFGIEKGVGWVAGVPNGLTLPIGKLLAGCSIIASGVTQYVTRYNCMIRATSLSSSPQTSLEQPDIEPPSPTSLSKPILKPDRHFWSPGVKTSHLGNVVYGLTRGSSLINSIYVFMGGCLGAFTIAQLGAGGVNYMCSLANTECSEKVDDAIWKLALLNGLAFIFGGAQLLSYVSYNLQRIADEYAPALFESGGKQYSKTVYALATLNAGVNGALAYVSNQHVIGQLNQYTLGQISPSLTISPLVTKIYSAVGVGTAFVTYFVMTVPSLERLNVALIDYSNELPRWYKMRGGIYLSLAYNSLTWGLYSAASVALVSNKWAGLEPLNYYVISYSILFGGILGTATTMASDLDAFRNETETQIDLFRSRVLILSRNPEVIFEIDDKKMDLRDALLSDRSSDETRSNLIDSEAFISSRLVPDSQITIVPEPALVGVKKQRSLSESDLSAFHHLTSVTPFLTKGSSTLYAKSNPRNFNSKLARPPSPFNAASLDV